MMSDQERREANHEARWLFGLVGGFWAIVVVGVFILALVSAGITIWWNFNVAPAVINSERHVQTCNISYMTTQETKIENQLNAIANDNKELTDPAYQDASTQAGIKAAEQESARSIYDALAQADCTRTQIISNMPELQDFFKTWPTRP